MEIIRSLAVSNYKLYLVTKNKMYLIEALDCAIEYNKLVNKDNTITMLYAA